MSESGNLIDGAWVAGTGAAFQSLDPATGEVLWQGAASTAGDVEAALAAARAALAQWSGRPFEERLEVLRAFGAAATKRQDGLARVIGRETGKVFWDALVESSALASKLDHSLKAYEERTPQRDQTSGAIRSRLQHRPLGVMAVFGPYNFPAHLPNGHIIPALLAGNTVVFKPSELTPWAAEETLKIWLEAGLPVRSIVHVPSSFSRKSRPPCWPPFSGGYLRSLVLPAGNPKSTPRMNASVVALPASLGP